eukprot:CAMPEP_0194281960 /NCGR_PEP_ID=MMETSP0169-20130528/22032_1 /TAXON_ID=218684 /ORGANISM="Corethron pennatum, Strain L29A3" /LENGTH=182 /DNA_ID=CAMNT_0039027155 /DNA_START=191 /DNA_END=739 /DNA_ORIENTATION=+
MGSQISKIDASVKLSVPPLPTSDGVHPLPPAPSASTDDPAHGTAAVESAAPVRVKRKVKSSDLSTPELAMIKCRLEKKAVTDCYSKWFTGGFLGIDPDGNPNKNKTTDSGTKSDDVGGGGSVHPSPTSAQPPVVPDREDCEDLSDIYQTCFLQHVKKYRIKRGMKPAHPESFVGGLDDDDDD